MYGFYLDKTTNEISLSRNFSRFSSQEKTTKSPSQKNLKPSDRFGVNQECFSKISFVKVWWSLKAFHQR